VRGKHDECNFSQYVLIKVAAYSGGRRVWLSLQWLRRDNCPGSLHA
jgi:hypothetical protein